MPRLRSAPRLKAPACTHITMERVPLSDPENYSCPSCGNNRTLGFLYICSQERDIAYLESRTGQNSDPKHCAKSKSRRELEHIGLSQSVIATAEQGLYTDEQLEKLKAGKLKLNRVIADAHRAAQIREAIVNVSADAQNTDGTFHSAFEAQEESSATCHLIACHHCRPYFRDRISMSFEAVFNDEIRPIHSAEANYLSVKSARVMQGIGLRSIPLPSSYKVDDASPSTLLSTSGFSNESSSPPSRSSMLTYQTTQTEMDSLSKTRRHRRRFYKMGRRTSDEIGRDLLHQMSVFTRHGLREAFKGVFRPSERESSSSGSNITLPMPRTAAARDAGDVSLMREFDMGALHRVRRQKERYDLRHASEHGSCSTGCEHESGSLNQQCSVRATDGDSECSGSRISVYSCTSEGSEIEVEGGVALTEEAVEMHTPDIIDESLALESIMTQV